MRCEDFPCCGHELGCCPDYDPDTGEQLNMKCTCGATVPLSSNSSLCRACLYDYPYDDYDRYDEDDYPEDDYPEYDEDYGDPPDEY